MNGHGSDDYQPFSTRMGIEPNEIQIGSINDKLKARIWNAIHEFCFQDSCLIERMDPGLRIMQYYPISQDKIIARIFDGVFKEDASLRYNVHDFRDRFFKLKWNRIYDLVDFMLSDFGFVRLGSLRDKFNCVLKEESAGYRIICNKVTPITNELEIHEVEKARHTGIGEIDEHIETAISRLSDRDSPDPRNAAKEAISAVEALCIKITGDSNADLRKALREIKKRNPKLFDPHLGKAVDELYSFSSEASGVRHSHAEGKTQVGFDEAKFMVVTCSAIINYLVKHC